MVQVRADSDLSFICEYCDQKFSILTVRFSILLYGVAFLTGKDSSYACITCPSCIKTLLIEPDNFSHMFSLLDEFVFPDGSYKTGHLQYNSSVFYRPDQIPPVKDVFRGFFHIIEINDPCFEKCIQEGFEADENAEQELLCTYVPGKGELPYGPFVSVWWFPKNDLEKFLKIENEQGFRALPRYVYKNEHIEDINNFCWKYFIGNEFAEEAWRNAGESIDKNNPIVEHLKSPVDRKIPVKKLLAHEKLYDLDEEGLKRLFEDLGEEPNVNKPASEVITTKPRDRELSMQAEAKFLEILLTDSDPFHPDAPDCFQDPFKGLWKTVNPFRDRTLPLEFFDFKPGTFGDLYAHAQLFSEISENQTKQCTLGFLKNNFLAFIDEYIELARQSDFCYGHIWWLKLKYLKQLHEIIREEVREEAKYAFFKEGKHWTIVFNGKTIRGLRGIGFDYLQYLVMYPYKYIKTIDLLWIDNMRPEDIEDDPAKKHSNPDSGKGGNPGIGQKETVDSSAIGDKKAFQELKSKYRELERAIEDAKEAGDNINIDLLYEEKDELEKYLRKAFNRKGQSRQFRDEHKKIKDKIGRSIDRALKALEKEDKEAEQHFKKSLSPYFSGQIVYTPNEDIDWKF